VDEVSIGQRKCCTSQCRTTKTAVRADDELQQYYIEQFLLDAAAKCDPDLLEVRWGTRIDGLHQGPDGVVVELATDTASYATECDFWLRAMGHGARAAGCRTSDERYVVRGPLRHCRIEISLDLPTERLAWFDPPSNPGRTMLMHKQPDNIWRLDYQLHSAEDSEEMIREDRVTPVVNAHLAMMGIDRRGD